MRPPVFPSPTSTRKDTVGTWREAASLAETSSCCATVLPVGSIWPSSLLSLVVSRFYYQHRHPSGVQYFHSISRWWDEHDPSSLTFSVSFFVEIAF